jgi:FKBP-type peptidyl-prolyl cis-trans isomerase 2
MVPHGAEEKSAVKRGELVRLDYELWADGPNGPELIDTSREEVAQNAKLPNVESRHFGPQPHLIGGEYFPPGVEAALEGIKIGEEIEREFAPADAFGERDPKLIELFSMHEIQRLPEMRRDDAHLDIGTVLTIRGRRGRVVSLTAARVRVDFNPPFAGRKLKGKFKALERIHDPSEQVKSLIELNYGRGSEFHVEVHDGAIAVKVPDRVKFDLQWVVAKPRIVDQIRTQLKPHTIRITEEYVTPKEEKKADEKKPAAEKAAKEEAPAEEAPKPHAHSAKPAKAKDE